MEVSANCALVPVVARLRAVALPDADPVSYTHLDVYKRQDRLRVEGVEQRLDVYKRQLQARAGAPELDQLVAHLALRLQSGKDAGQRLRWLSASVGDTIKMFSIDEVQFFQSDEKYTRVVTATDEAHVRKPLRELAEGLDGDEFWQVHRGLIVRASAIARAHRDELGRITLQLKSHREKLSVSQAWAWRFKPM